MDKNVLCKKCGSTSCRKAGFVRQNQRYTCKECGCQFQPNRRNRQIEPRIIELLKPNGE